MTTVGALQLRSSARPLSLGSLIRKLAGEFKLMRYLSTFALLASATILTPPATAAELPQGAPISALVKDVSIPYSTFTLKNGLRVVVHEDHKAPVVAISVWYHVGSKDE